MKIVDRPSPIIDRKESADPSLSGNWVERNGGKALFALLLGATALSMALNGSHNTDSVPVKQQPVVSFTVENPVNK